MTSRLCCCYVTAPSMEVAQRLAGALVEQRLAACVNITAGVTSVYRWEGKTETSAEHLMMIKTRRSAVPQLIEVVKSSHPYDCPEVIAVDIVDGSEQYLRWVESNVDE